MKKLIAAMAFMASLAAPAGAATACAAPAATKAHGSFDVGDKTFLLNGRPFVVKAARYTIRAFRASIGSTAYACARLSA